MTEKEFADTLWLCLYTDETGIGIVGVFSSEEEAFKALPENNGIGQYWMCPTDLDIRVSSEADRFADMPDRVYPVYALDVEVTQPKKKTGPQLKVVK